MIDITQSTTRVRVCVTKITIATTALSEIPIRVNNAKKNRRPILDGTIGKFGSCEARYVHADVPETTPVARYDSIASDAAIEAIRLVVVLSRTL